MIRTYLLFLTLVFASGFACEANAESTSTMQQVEVIAQALHKLTWRPPLERTNGDPLPEEDILGYRVERLNDEGAILETVELDGATLELGIAIVPDTCMVYKAYAIATDGTPPVEGAEQGTLTSEPTDMIRICVIPPRRPRDFQVQ